MNLTIMIIAGLVAMAWTALGVRLIRLAKGRSFQFLKPTETAMPSQESVDAIVPARNEEANLAGTVGSLRNQDYNGLSITIVDDQSTDATASILHRLASESGSLIPLRVIHGVERPEGWVGKTWAVHQGVAEGQGKWLWFVDADMGLHPQALTSAIAEANRTGADLVSLLPGVRCVTFWQGTIAASFLQLLGQLYPLDRVNDPSRPEAIAAGGFILVRRTAYEAAGGHEACRGSIIEDIQLARNVKAAGGRLVVRLAPDLAWTHMYGRFGEIWRGLRKNAYAGMDYMPHKYATGAIIALGLAWAPVIALIWGMIQKDGWAVGIGLWGMMAQVLASVPVLVFLRLPMGFGLSLPPGISAYVAIATASVWHHHRGRILWKDRVLSSKLVVEPLRTTRLDRP